MCCERNKINENSNENYQNVTDINTQRINNNKFTILNGKFLINAKIIAKFINFYLRKNYEKSQIKKLHLKLKENFCVKTIEKKDEFKKFYYENLMKKMIENFFFDRENIKNDILKENNIFEGLHDFDYLKEMIKKNYSEDICNNKINFYSNFIKYIHDKKKLNKIINEPRRSSENILKKNIKKIIQIEQLLNLNVNNNNNNNNKINSEEEIKKIKANREFIEKDIDNLFKIILNKENTIEKKLKDFDNDEMSFLLLLLSEELNYNTQIFITGKLRKFIKVFYNIYLLKHYNFISNTGEEIYFKVNKTKLKKYLNDPKFFFDINNKESFKNINKNLLFKKIFSDNLIKTSKTKFTTKKKIKFLDEIDENQIDENSELNNNKNKILKKKTNISMFQEKNNDYNLKILTSKNNISTIKSKEYDSPKIRKKSTNIISKKKSKYSSEVHFHDDSIINNSIKSATTKKMIFINIEEENIQKRKSDIFNINLNEKDKEEIYNGQFDNNIFVYSGFGNLINQNKSSFYFGTFRYGKKEGFGIYYRILSQNDLIYYMGEFNKNKFNGFGIFIEIDDENFIKFHKGNFSDGKFLNGESLILVKNNLKKNFVFMKFKGDCDSNFSSWKLNFKNFGNLQKIVYDGNKIDYEYNYIGRFENGFEEGNGYLNCNLKNKGYSYNYTGEFKNGKKNGYGIIKYSSNFFIKSYEGFFLNDEQFNCYGIVNFKSGDKYEGFFDENMMKDNVGIYYYYDPILKKSVDNYFGMFSKDMKNGFGRFLKKSNSNNNNNNEINNEINNNNNNINIGKILIGFYIYGGKEGNFELINYEEDLEKKEKFNEEMNEKKMGIKKKLNNVFKFDKVEMVRKFLIKQKKYFYFQNNILMDDGILPFNN